MCPICRQLWVGELPLVLLLSQGTMPCTHLQDSTSRIYRAGPHASKACFLVGNFMLAEQPHTCTSGHCRSPGTFHRAPVALECHIWGGHSSQQWVCAGAAPQTRENKHPVMCTVCLCKFHGRRQVLNKLQPPSTAQHLAPSVWALW